MQRGGKIPVNSQKISRISGIFPGFLETFGEFWKVSANLPDVLQPLLKPQVPTVYAESHSSEQLCLQYIQIN